MAIPKGDYIENPNTQQEFELVKTVYNQFKAAYLAKDNEGLHSDWAEYEEYWAGNANPPEDEDDPGSENNIILPVIESQIADLVDEPKDIIVSGVEPSDHFFSHDVQKILEWVITKNKFEIKLDEHERNRLKFGTGIWKVWFDPHALRSRGLPIIEPICPSNFFPDPKIKRAWQLQDCEFIIQANYQSLFILRKRFGKRAKAVRPEGKTLFNIEIFKGEDASEISAEINDRALLIERWTKEVDDNGEVYLRLVCVANGVLLYDSNWDADNRGYKSYYKNGKYPFVVTPCYARKGTLWGMGDIELLKPVQDLINELDDQIRMNARLMGNIQIVVGLASGINVRKWTNKPGLKIPARDHTAWEIVRPPDIPAIIPNRRMEAKMEAQEYSGRSDAVEGRRPGGIRAASAIIALQEAGSRRVNHKKLMLQVGLSEVMQLVVDMVAEHYQEEMAFRILNRKPNSWFGNENDEYLWFRGSDLNNIPKYIPGMPITNPETGQEETPLVPLVSESGESETKSAEFDIVVSIGAGLPHNKAFLYQAVVELQREGLITREEGRLFLKQMMSFPIIDPLNPIGQFVGRNMSPEAMAMANGGGMGNNYGNIPVEEPQMEPMPEDIPPEVMNSLVQRMGGGNIAG